MGCHPERKTVICMQWDNGYVQLQCTALFLMTTENEVFSSFDVSDFA